MPLFAFTILLSSFLLFLIQPLIAKLIAPWFGGSAAVWIVCLMFFQSTLLLGYLYAYAVTRFLRPRAQCTLHVALLGGSLVLVALTHPEYWKTATGGDPTWRIAVLLACTIGLPYFLLSATSPLLQAWYSRMHPAGLPYRLFSYSNAASLLALFAYPLLVEPNAPTRLQLSGWSWGYAAFVLVCGAVGWSVRELPDMGRGVVGPPPTLRLQVFWLLLSACGSMLLLSITNHLTQNIASVPFLWIVPLAIFLMTFVLAFAKHQWLARGLILRLVAVAIGSMAYLIYETGLAHLLQLGIPIFCFGLFACCLFCHSEIAATKPAAPHLTLFYLVIALGGAAGALFVGLAAPRIFAASYELPMSLVLTAALVTGASWRDGWSSKLLWSVVTAATVAVLIVEVGTSEVGSMAKMRSFYGTLRVVNSGGPQNQLRTLYHGTISHGSQFLLPPRRFQATTYYGPSSGAALALLSCCGGPKRVGVIGLGAGSLAAYGRRGDYFRFYEINPQVEQIAKTAFTYLRESPAKVDIVLGDARLSLESEAPQRFDVLLVDAFSGDAVPVHLLTRQAFAVYLSHLAPAGVLAFHVSNSYLHLSPVVRQLADYYGMQSGLTINAANRAEDVAAADWVLVADAATLARLPGSPQSGKPVAAPPGLRLWTDDYSSLIPLIKAGR